MMNDPRTEPLREWNRLARENAENAIIASMFETTSKASEPIETFSTWLLLGTAAIASFLITNADKILPLIKSKGFSWCGLFLCASCIFGLLSKMYALSCKIGNDLGGTIKRIFFEHLEKHKVEERKIKEGAEFWGITLETGVRLERIIAEFYAALPKWIVWFSSRQTKKYAGSPYMDGILQVKRVTRQGIFASLQALSFLGFLVAGFIFATM